jgi:hypothetical protein
MNTYVIKQDASGNDYLEMTAPDGVVSFVPMVAGNADYEAYLNPEEVKADEAKAK